MISKKIKSMVIGLIIIGLFLPIVPVVSSGDTPPTWWEDLIISRTPISVTHWWYNTKHTASVYIQNRGNYPVNETFTLALCFEIYDTQGGPGSFTNIHEFNIIGCNDGQEKGPYLYTHTWSNPDPNRYGARFYAYVDSDYEVDEWKENNNDGYSNWFP